MALSSYIQQLTAKRDLTESEAIEAFSELLSPKISETDKIEFLTALSLKGESVSEVVGFCKGLRARMIRLTLPLPLLDVCGTGGSGKPRFNVSTAAAFVLATGGVPVAKHGNRGSRTPTGSFDFLEALGVPFGQNAGQIQTIFARTNLCFLFARAYHPALAPLASVRKQIEGPTIFNLIGPLCNPAGVSHQILGTSSVPRARLLAESLLELGIDRALVFAGDQGRDELSVTGPSQIFELNKGVLTEYAFYPDFITIPILDAQLEGQDSAVNAELFKDLIKNAKIDHPISEWIALNAGAGFYIMDRVASIEEGYRVAQSLIQSGQVWESVKPLLRE